MKFVIVLSVLVACTFAAQTYPDNYDNVDIDALLKSGRTLTNYIKCAMDQGPCTKEGRDLKKILPDALANGCSKCTPKQKEAAEKVINHLKTKRRPDWDRLLKKYDPKGEYEKRYEASRKVKA